MSWSTLKPAAPPRVQLLLAASTWSIVGAALLTAGVRWSLAASSWPLLLVVGAAAGVVKAALVLRRTARRVVDRIRVRGDGRCAGGFFSWKTWIVVAAMAVAGRLVRSAGVPLAVIGVVYVAVGVALLVGSGWLWRAWRTTARRHAAAPGGNTP